MLANTNTFCKGGSIVSGAFDPYHRWLGIPPKDQPPNHYRLLGLDLFEADTEVIRDAAEQRIAHVRTYQLGQYAELSQRILNELAAAKTCLFDAAKKAVYDAAMKRPVRRPTETPALSENIYSLMPAVPIVKPPIVSRPNGRTNVANSDIESPLRAVASGKSKVAKPGHRPKIDGGGLENTSSPWTPSHITYPTTNKRPSRPHVSLTIWGGIVTVVVLAFGMILSFSGYQKVVKCFETGSSPPRMVDQHQAKPNPPSTPLVRPPKLAPIKDYTVDEGAMIRFQAGVVDAGTVGPALRFAIEPSAPAGAAIDVRSGVFSWIPSREQAPGEYRITLRATAEGQNGLGDKTVFRVCVRKLVKPPVIQPISEQTVKAGSTARFPVVVTNSAGPSETIVFSLPEAPSWVSIDPATGVVTCNPDQTVLPERYSVTVRAVNDKEERSRGERTLGIVVAIPRIAKPAKTPGDLASGVSTIRLPSGTTVASAEIHILDRVRNEISVMETKCRENAPGFIGLSQQEGSQSDVAPLPNVNHGKHKSKQKTSNQFRSQSDISALSKLKGTKLYGVTILFHTQGYLKPKEYITYRNGTLHGEVASWDEQGQQQFWGNYVSGQPDGICCLFKDDRPIMVLECTRNNVNSVHLITGNEITKSFTAVAEAKADDTAGPLLKEINECEERVKADERAHYQRVTKAINLKVGFENKKKRDNFQNRSNEREKEQENIKRSARKLMGF